MTCQGKRDCARGVSVKRTEAPVRLANSNITVPDAVTPVNRGTVLGQTLELEIDGTEQMRVPGCDSNNDCHELTAGLVPVRSTPYFLQRCPKGRWVLDDLPAQPLQQCQVYESWPSRR